MLKEPVRQMLKDVKSTADQYDRWVAERGVDGAWLGTSELITMAHLLDVPIWTYVVADGSSGQWQVFVGKNKSLDRPSLYLSNINHHYEVVLSLKADQLKKRQLLKRPHPESNAAAIDLTSSSPGVKCASARKTGYFLNPVSQTNDECQQEEQLLKSMEKVAVSADSQGTNVTPTKSAFRSFGAALAKNVFGLLGSAVKAVSGVGENVIRVGVSYSEIAEKVEQMVNKGLSCVCLMPYSAQVAQFNDFMLHKKCTDIVTISAVDANISSTKSKRPAKTANVKSRQKRAADTGGLEDQLIVAKGACVMLRRNIDVDRGLVNGAIGKVTDICRRDNQVSTIKVLFPGSTGVVDIERITVEYEVGNKIWNERTQFPLTLSWAMTVHKSQGVSVDSAVIDLSAACFEPGMAYVGLSRVRKLDQLHLISFDPTVLDCHGAAARGYSRLRQLATPPLPEIAEVNNIKERGEEYQRRKYRATLTRRVDGEDDDVPPPPKLQKASRQSYVPVFAQEALQNETRRWCFANAVLVCLNNLHNLYTASDSSPLYAELKKIKAKSVTSARHLVDILNSYLPPGERLHSHQQQDSGEFLMKLMARLPRCRRQMFEYQRVMRRRCRNCNGIVSEQLLTESFLILPFTDATANCTFREALSRSKRNATAQLHCRDCEQLTVQDPEEALICGQEYLVVQLDLFATPGNPDLSKRLADRQIRGFDAAKMTIGGCDYCTVGAVLHVGESINSGHYTAMCRSVVSRWQLINDLVGTEQKDRFVSLLRNCYLLIMTKI